MSRISNDAEFKQALHNLSPVQQRIVAASFVEHILPLSKDNRLKNITKIALDKDASDDELASALKSAKAATFDSHTRCGSEGNWTDQAGYFVARAIMAALTPLSQSKAGGPAWQAAMHSRIAQTSSLIDSGDVAPTDNQWQYDILSNYLNAK